MRVDARRPLAGFLAAAVLAGCTEAGPPPIVGTLEWDRIAVTAELAEPVLAWHVAEGDRVAAGDVILTLDARRQDARIAEARSQLAAMEARFAELTHGARSETLDAARAHLASARAAQTDAETEYARAAEVRKRELVAQSVVDQALAARNQRRAETDAVEAELRELTAGTRPEQIEHGAATVDAARGPCRRATVSRRRPAAARRRAREPARR